MIRISKERLQLSNKKKISATQKWSKDLNRYCSIEYIQVANTHVKKTLDVISHLGNANQNHSIPLSMAIIQNKTK